MLRAAFVVTLLLTSISIAQEGAPTSDPAMLAAENRMLRVQVARLQATIAELRTEVAALHGTADSPAPTTEPAVDESAKPNINGSAAENRASRVVFAIEGRGTMGDQMRHVRDEILKAIGNLKRGQESAIIWIAEGRIRTLAPTTLPPTARNLDRAQHFLDGLAARGEGGGIHELIHAACAFDPQTVWLITRNYEPNDSAEVERVLAARGSNSFRINTLFLPLNDSEKSLGILGTIAIRTGGICVDINGRVLVPPTPSSSSRIEASFVPRGPSALDEK